MSSEQKMNMDRQLHVTEFIYQNKEASFNEQDTKTLFNFYSSDNKNATASEMTQLLLDILFVANVTPIIVSDEILTSILREFCWKSCTSHECTLSWHEFKSFFEYEKQPLTKLLNMVKSSYNIDCAKIFSAKYMNFNLMKSNKNKIFNFDFDEDDRSKLKSAILKLVPTVPANKIFTYIINENEISALVVGDIDINNYGNHIEVNDITYQIKIDPFYAAFPKTNKDEFYAAEIITVYIDGINGTLTSVECYSFLSIHDFIDIMYDRLGVSKQYKLLLVHNHLIINETVDRDKSLQYYNIGNNSCLLAYIADGMYSGHNNFAEFDPELAYVMKLSLEEYESKKFMDTQQNIRDKCCALKYSDRFEIIEDLDILLYEMNNNCIKMSCGHGITQNTLYQYTIMQLKNCEKLIKCPHIVDDKTNKLCNKIWYYPEIRHVLFPKLVENNMSTPQFLLKDIIKLDRMCGMNTIQNDYNTKECIKCHSLMYKNKYSTAGWCPICNYRFCWKCNGKCSLKCSSNLENEVMDILRNCNVKTIGSVKCVPSIRCCPQCLQLITHTTACKHVQCSSCKCSFCFVCMKPKKNNQWQCGNYSAVCPIAPNKVPNII
eukprot:277503_1